MWEFINNNAKPLSVLASFGTMLIWLFYAHLLLQGFRRQRQARVLINQGWGEQIRSVAIVSNMSHEPIYIQCVVLSLKLADGRKFRNSVTDFENVDSWNHHADPREVTRQGPLQRGAFMNLGTFETLLRHSAHQHGLIDAETPHPVQELGVTEFKLTVICNYGPSGKAVGAQRRFLVRGEAQDRLYPATIYTRRMVGRRARKKLERWLYDHMSDVVGAQGSR